MGPGCVSPTRFPGGHADWRAVVRGPRRHGGLGAHTEAGTGAQLQERSAEGGGREGRPGGSPGAGFRVRASGATGASTRALLAAGFASPCRVRSRARACRRRHLGGAPAQAWGAWGGARARNLERQGSALASFRALLEGARQGGGGRSLDSSQVADSPLPVVPRPQKVVVLQAQSDLENKGRPVSHRPCSFRAAGAAGRLPPGYYC